MDTQRHDAAQRALQARIENAAPLGLFLTRYDSVGIIYGHATPLGHSLGQELCSATGHFINWVAVQNPRQSDDFVARTLKELTPGHGMPAFRLDDDSWRSKIETLIQLADIIVCEYFDLSEATVFELETIIRCNREDQTVMVLPHFDFSVRKSHIPLLQKFPRCIYLNQLQGKSLSSCLIMADLTDRAMKISKAQGPEGRNRTDFPVTLSTACDFYAHCLVDLARFKDAGGKLNPPSDIEWNIFWLNYRLCRTRSYAYYTPDSYKALYLYELSNLMVGLFDFLKADATKVGDPKGPALRGRTEDIISSIEICCEAAELSGNAKVLEWAIKNRDSAKFIHRRKLAGEITYESELGEVSWDWYPPPIERRQLIVAPDKLVGLNFLRVRGAVQCFSWYPEGHRFAS
jgi:hypothetical protein